LEGLLSLFDAKSRKRTAGLSDKLGGGAIIEEVCYVVKGDSLQIRREGDDVNMIFQ
jgi:hypothetical protein